MLRRDHEEGHDRRQVADHGPADGEKGIRRERSNRPAKAEPWSPEHTGHQSPQENAYELPNFEFHNGFSPISARTTAYPISRVGSPPFQKVEPLRNNEMRQESRRR